MKKFTLLLVVAFLCLFGISTAQVPVINSVSGPTAVCSAPGAPKSYTASASNSPSSYSWSVTPSAGVIITNSNSAIATIGFPYSNATYTITVKAANASGTSTPVTYVVTVFETPTVTFSGATFFCAGNSTNIQATATSLAASPTISYLWTPSSGLNTTSSATVNASPSVTTTYTVYATKGFCSNSKTITITPIASPNLSVSAVGNPVCLGNSVIVNASGANTITISNGIQNGIAFTPSLTGVINAQVIGQNTQGGCQDTVNFPIYVNPTPTVSAYSNYSVLCITNTAVIGVNSTATSYSINNVPFNFTVAVSPTVTTTYIIQVENSFGCKASAPFTQSVTSCVGISEHNITDDKISVFPNPSHGIVKFVSIKDENVDVLNEMGQAVHHLSLKENEEATLELPQGLYILNAGSKRLKIVIIK